MSEIEVLGNLPDGTPIERVTLSAGGLTAKIINWGAVLQDLRLDGHGPSLVLGLNTIEDYLAHSRYFGATAGRCANRIANGRFTLGGKEYQLDTNFLGKHHLHGGSAGIGKRVWRFDRVLDHQAVLSIDLEDGEMGYPAAMHIRQTITLDHGGVFDILLEAESDQPTLCNLAHHSYFNLDGSDTILDHELTLAADHYLPVDEELIPTGEIRSTDGQWADFKTPRRLGEICQSVAIDHNFCLANERRPIAFAARLFSPRSGISMDVATSEPGLQVYDGAKLDVPVDALDGRKIGPHGGIALEPQVWPDAINHSQFPQALLNPGETYVQNTRFVFQQASNQA